MTAPDRPERVFVTSCSGGIIGWPTEAESRHHSHAKQHGPYVPQSKLDAANAKIAELEAKLKGCINHIEKIEIGYQHNGEYQYKLNEERNTALAEVRRLQSLIERITNILERHGLTDSCEWLIDELNKGKASD